MRCSVTSTLPTSPHQGLLTLGPSYSFILYITSSV